MTEVTVIFPHQLFEHHPALKKGRKVILIEHPLYFGTDKQYPTIFHKQKLIFHRATMKAYENELNHHGFDVDYIEFDAAGAADLQHLRQYKVVHAVEPVDFELKKRLANLEKLYETKIMTYQTPMFLNSREENESYFTKESSFFQTKFYKYQRQKYTILVDDEGQPHGGSWTFDKDNRKKIPQKVTVPDLPKLSANSYVNEAKQYITKHFSQNLGNTSHFIYPVERKAAKQWLTIFLEERFTQFGPYEDAISNASPALFHSVLSPLLNVGLLTPQEVLDAAIAMFDAKNIPIESTEGFVRQIIGWREFMRAVYEIKGVEMRNCNVLKNTKRLSGHWYNASLGIAPVDDVIKKVNSFAYAHHIERLMIVGNFMMLCDIHPQEVYSWFMEFFIDAYDWVMVPNVYGMSQFADGGSIVTKPYVSGSNYIIKMSNYKKGEWADIWDGLYWRFVNNRRKLLSKNHRMGFMIATFDKMDASRKKMLQESAENFLAKISN